MERLQERLVNGPTIKEWDGEALTKLCDEMYKCEVSFESWGKDWMLNNQELMHKLFQRLPYKIKSEFVRISNESSSGGTFHELRVLVEKAASAADSQYGRLLCGSKMSNPKEKTSIPGNRGGKIVCATQQPNTIVKSRNQCKVCSKTHPLWKCPEFKKKSIEEKRNVVKVHNLCYNCLISGHRVMKCENRIRCRQCGRKHNTILHVEDSTPEKAQKEKREESSAPSCSDSEKLDQQVGTSGTCSAVDSLQPHKSGQTYFKVVPVKVWGPDPAKAEYTYAFTDEGSSVNLCSQDLVKRLGVPITETMVELQTRNAASMIKERIDTLAIQGVGEEPAFVVKDVLVMNKIVDVSDSILTETVARAYSHLQDIDFPELENRNVELLLGSSLHQAFLLQEQRVGAPGEPSGLHTALGWVIYGKDEEDQSFSVPPRFVVNFVNTKTETKQSCQELLKIMNHDFQDVEMDVGEVAMSQEDKQAVSIMESTVTKIGEHYSVGLLWKQNPPKLQNNRPLAVKRMEGLRMKFKRDPSLFDKYSAKINEYIDNGYAVQIPEESLEATEKTNYIPHHCTSVLTKFRVVFDCSARYKGVCLNDLLLGGPDLTNNLVGVLLRFKQYPTAFVADIKQMFSQVFVNENDRDALRFLWFAGNDFSQPLVEYQMQTHVFGAKCSPCCAAFALRRTATDNAVGVDDDTVRTVMRNIYVDDLCKSCATTEDAKRIVSQLRNLLVSGGFHLTKFVSNTREVLADIPSESLASSVELGNGRLPPHKTLGVFWDAETDTLNVHVDIKQKPHTRRGLLSMINQTYDPLGILPPFLLPARLLLQEACRAELGWDEPLDQLPGIEPNWGAWFAQLSHLESISMRRNFVTHEKGHLVWCELHTFVDSSTVGYGACSYLRCVYSDGSIEISFVMGKSRVTPLKPMSMPRLELVAAVLGAKLGMKICNELDLHVNRVYYWTDAMVVLRYIHNVSTRFEIFIANRLNVLHALTSVDQWRHVPRKLNPADLASRGMQPCQASNADLWLKGPKFLMLRVSEWPDQPDFIDMLVKDLSSCDIACAQSCCFNVCKNSANPLYRLFARYSTFEKLLTATAWILRFKLYMRVKYLNTELTFRTEPLRAEDYDAAKHAILRTVQYQVFPGAADFLLSHRKTGDAIQRITQEDANRVAVLKDIRDLSPILLNDLLCVGGRLQNSSLPISAKHPIILPYDHPVTNLLIQYHHEKEGHFGVNHVLADMNKEFWIIKGHSAVKKVLNSCATCQFWKAKAGQQQMADLPFQRVNKTVPFTSIGTDLMGPVNVRIGRNNVKRWICIFNCLATRAVHLEVLQSLDVHAFMQGFSRFCSRRNVFPKEVYSDNGGNVVAAKKELDKLYGSSKWRSSKFGKTIQWHFNPPRASHHGGFYEIFFRLFRKVFSSIVKNSTLDEFDLLTYVAEIERILNNRPITALASTPDDFGALTPSSILTGSLCEDAATDSFLKGEAYRRSWKKSQFLADLFWQQWLDLYLPLLQSRRKWFGTSRNLKPGDLVLIVNEQTRRGQWPKAIVTEVFSDSNGLVRSAKL